MKEQSQAPKEPYPERELVPEREYQRVAISGEEKCGVATALFFTFLLFVLYKNKILLAEPKWTLQTLYKLLRENQVSYIHTKYTNSWGKHELTTTQLRGFHKKKHSWMRKIQNVNSKKYRTFKRLLLPIFIQYGMHFCKLITDPKKWSLKNPHLW